MLYPSSQHNDPIQSLDLEVQPANHEANSHIMTEEKVILKWKDFSKTVWTLDTRWEMLWDKEYCTWWQNVTSQHIWYLDLKSQPLTWQNICIAILWSVAVEAGALESDRVVLFFGQPAKLVFQVCITGFRVDLTKFPYAGTEIFGLNLSYSAGDGFKQGIVNEYVLSLQWKRKQI